MELGAGQPFATWRIFQLFFFYAAVRKYIVSYTFEIIDDAYMNQRFPHFFNVGVERGLRESETSYGYPENFALCDVWTGLQMS